MLEFRNVMMNEEGSAVITTYDLDKKEFVYIFLRVNTDASKAPFEYEITNNIEELDTANDDGEILFPKPHKRVTSKYTVALIQNMYSSLYNNILVHEKDRDYRIVNPK